jgi:hypothetical protein
LENLRFRQERISAMIIHRGKGVEPIGRTEVHFNIRAGLSPKFIRNSTVCICNRDPSFRPRIFAQPMSPSVSQEPTCLEQSEWSGLLGQLPLFPPAAQPPPTLFPLLSPLLQQKLSLLSVGRGRGWPAALTWLSSDLSYKVNERLKSSWRPDGLEEQFQGYRRLDDDLVLSGTLSNSNPYI